MRFTSCATASVSEFIHMNQWKAHTHTHTHLLTPVYSYLHIFNIRSPTAHHLNHLHRFLHLIFHICLCFTNFLCKLKSFYNFAYARTYETPWLMLREHFPSSTISLQNYASIIYLGNVNHSISICTWKTYLIAHSWWVL